MNCSFFLIFGKKKKREEVQPELLISADIAAGSFSSPFLQLFLRFSWLCYCLSFRIQRLLYMGAASSFNALDADTYYTKTQVQSLFQENGIPSMDFTKTFEENAEADGSISGATLRYLVQTQEQNHQQLGPPHKKINSRALSETCRGMAVMMP